MSRDTHTYAIPLPSVDWQRVMLNIRSKGVPLARLRNIVGMDDRNLQRIARGEVREPKFRQGYALLYLHQKLCPREHEAQIYDRA